LGDRSVAEGAHGRFPTRGWDSLNRHQSYLGRQLVVADVVLVSDVVLVAVAESPELGDLLDGNDQVAAREVLIDPRVSFG